MPRALAAVGRPLLLHLQHTVRHPLLLLKHRLLAQLQLNQPPSALLFLPRLHQDSGATALAQRRQRRVVVVVLPTVVRQPVVQPWLQRVGLARPPLSAVAARRYRLRRHRNEAGVAVATI